MFATGMVILALLFLLSGVNHIRKHEDMAGYTGSVLGECPFKTQLGYLGGWPTGIYLAATGGLVAFQQDAGLWMAGGFLVLATILFHRNLKDPGSMKNIALIGAVLALLAK